MCLCCLERDAVKFSFHKLDRSIFSLVNLVVKEFLKFRDDSKYFNLHTRYILNEDDKNH